jgi:hypothetical protein
MTRAEAVKRLVKDKRRWEVRSAGKGSKGERLIRAAGLRWPVEEDFEFSKDCFGLDQYQARLYTAIAQHVVLVMAAARRARHDPADRPGDQATARRTHHPAPAALARHPLARTDRRHRARSRWSHKHARLARLRTCLMRV